MATFPTDSLGKHLRDTLAAALVGVASEDAIMWSSQPGAGPFTPNPDFWLSPRPTCVLSKHPSHGKFNGCLVTRRHVVLAKHTSTGWPGTNFRFANAAGAVFDYVSTARTVIAGTDIAIAELNADVDESITPAKLLPANLTDVLVGRYRDPVPSVIVNRAENARLMSMHWDTAVDYHHEPNPDMLATRTGQLLDSPYIGMFYTPIWGDSGSPWLLLINGEWCLIGCMGSTMSVPALHAYHTEIAAVTGEEYEPEVADLSGFVVPDAASPEAESGLPIDVPFPEITDLGGGMASVTAYPTSIVLDDTYGVGGLNYDQAWTNPNNAAAEDGNVAVESVATTGGGGNGDSTGPQPMNGVGFDFSGLPDDATITSIVYYRKDRKTGTGYALNTTGDARNNSDRASLLTASNQYGSGYESGHNGTKIAASGAPGGTLANRSWTFTESLPSVATIKGNAHFGVKHMWAWEFLGSGTASTYEVDAQWITINYTEAAPPSTTFRAPGNPLRRGSRSAV